MSMPELKVNQTEYVEIPDEPEQPEAPRPKKKRLFRAEWILAVIAVLSAAALAAMVVLCLPYMGPGDEDPQSVSRHEQATQDQVPDASQDPDATEPESQPESEPTVPPDPNPYTVKDFQYDQNNYLRCLRQDSYAGVDVSAFQGTSTGSRSGIPASTSPLSVWATVATARQDGWWKMSSPRTI